MKKSILSLILLVILVSCNGKKCVINGSTDIDGPIVIISDLNDYHEELSAEIEDGKFTIEIDIENSYPAIAAIDSSHFAYLFLEPGNINIEIGSNLTVSSTNKTNEILCDPLAFFQENKMNELGLIGIYQYVHSVFPEPDIMDLLDETTCSEIKESKFVTDYLTRRKNIGKEIADIISDEDSLSLYSLTKEKNAVICFWASWSKKSREDISYYMIPLSSRYPDISFVYVNVNDNQDNYHDVAKELGISYSSLYDKNGKSCIQYGITDIPHMILTDREGKIVADGINADKIEKELINSNFIELKFRK